MFYHIEKFQCLNATMPNNVYPQHFQHHKQLMILCSCSERVNLETAAYGSDSVNVNEKLNMTASATCYPGNFSPISNKPFELQNNVFCTEVSNISGNNILMAA